MDTNKIAKICHDANRSYCQTIGDFTQKNWENAPDWQKESAIKGVQFIIDNPQSTPAASHESWLKEKEATGWKYGPVKDEVKKEHPCFVPYDQLPENQKAKDALFSSIVRAFMPKEVVKVGKPAPEEKPAGKKFQLMAVINGNEIVKPIIEAETDAEAREKFLKDNKAATIHKCEPVT